ncbi:MAG TPA: helix-turn-helix domain-containing protein [Caulobacteraceae bacterium]|nr:helix-turn-helix domain-containing protein [Caulobacteraceae bacterium]
MPAVAAALRANHVAEPFRAGGSPGSLTIVGAAKTYGNDQQIFGQGEATDYVYRVVSGAVRSFRVLADGRRQIDDFYLPGDVFGVELDVERSETAEAVGEVVVVAARRATIASDPEQAAKLWRHALGELSRSREHALTLGRRSASERVASFLIDLNARLGADGELELPMSRQDMADYLGLTIETVSRTMTQLQGQRLIQLNGCRRVRLSRLSALVELCE